MVLWLHDFRSVSPFAETAVQAAGGGFSYNGVSALKSNVESDSIISHKIMNKEL